MPLYRNTETGHRVRTLDNSHEDNRLGLSSDWQLVDETPPPDPPDRDALKADWIAHAIDRGVPSYEAHNMTKAELIERLGG